MDVCSTNGVSSFSSDSTAVALTDAEVKTMMLTRYTRIVALLLYCVLCTFNAGQMM